MRISSLTGLKWLLLQEVHTAYPIFTASHSIFPDTLYRSYAAHVHSDLEDTQYLRLTSTVGAWLLLNKYFAEYLMRIIQVPTTIQSQISQCLHQFNSV